MWKRKLLVGPVRHKLGEEAGAEVLRQRHLGAVHVTEGLRPSLVTLGADNNESLRAFTQEFVHRSVEQGPGRVQPQVSASPVGFLVVRVQAEGLLEVFLLEVEGELEPLYVDVAQ